MKNYKKPVFKLLSLAVSLAFALPLCAVGLTVTACAEGSSENIYDRVESYLSDIVPKAHFPSFAVTIVDKDSVLLSEAYGDNGSTTAPYLLGSVSKSFTALCVMKLAEQGKLDLNAHLSEYLPDVNDADRITIIQLLNHTSGLGEHQNMGNCKITEPQGVHTYANVNYSLLGKVVEAVSGMSFRDYVAENVTKPLGLKNTYADPDEAESRGLMPGYENLFGINVQTECRYDSSDNAWITVPAGYISSSAEDLGRYLQMYLNGGENIISPESVNEMFYSSVAVEDYIPYRYGMGWTLVNEPLKQPALRHSGLVETGMSCVYLLPESGIGIAVAINANDYFVGKDFADRIGWGIVLMLMGEEPNQIGDNEYLSRHLLYDAVYLAVIAISLLPLALLGAYKKRLEKGSLRVRIIFILLPHLLLPAFILLLLPVFFGTPLWVARAFVPDLFAAAVISSCLLFGGGAVKICLLLKKRKT